MKTSLSSRQMAVIAGIIVFANKMLLLPSMLYQFSRGDSLLLLLMMFAIDFAVLCIFFSLKRKFQTQSFFEILRTKLGKPIAIFIFLLLLVYFFAYLVLTFNATHVYFKSQVYHNDQKSIYFFSALVIMSLVAGKGLRALGRTIEFCYIPIVLGLLFCLLVSFPNFEHPLVLFTVPAKQFFTGAYKFVFTFGDFLLLFLIIDRFEYSEKNKNQIIKYVLSAMLIVVVLYFLFFSIFQYTAFMHTNAISDIIVLSYEIFDIGRVDIVAVVTIMLITLCQLCLYAYVITVVLRSIFPKMTKPYSIMLIIIAFLLVNLLWLNNFESLVTVVTVWLPILAIFLQYFLPICTLFFSQNKKEER